MLAAGVRRGVLRAVPQDLDGADRRRRAQAHARATSCSSATAATACHKVDWFPTKRRPGPPLTNLQAKMTPEFVSAWVARSQGLPPDDLDAADLPPRELRARRDDRDLGLRRRAARSWARSGTRPRSRRSTAFLLDRAPRASRCRADPGRGRRARAAARCCALVGLPRLPQHWRPTPARSRRRRATRARTPRHERARPEPARRRHQGRRRSGSTPGSRIPTRYWPETRMPNLRLSDQEAADIVAYMIEDPDGIFQRRARGLEPERPSSRSTEREVLARAGALVLQRATAARASSGASRAATRAPWDDLDAAQGRRRREARAAPGLLLVPRDRRACEDDDADRHRAHRTGARRRSTSSTSASCPRSSAAGSKPRTTSTARAGSLQKLHAPRSFDREKVKNPNEKLRMPWFDFTDEEVAGDRDLRRRAGRRRGAAREDDPERRRARDGRRAARRAPEELRRLPRARPGHGRLSRTRTASQHTVHGRAACRSRTTSCRRRTTWRARRSTRRSIEFEVDEVGLRLLAPEPRLGAPSATSVFVSAIDLLSLWQRPRRRLRVASSPTTTSTASSSSIRRPTSEEEAYSYVTARPRRRTVGRGRRRRAAATTPRSPTTRCAGRSRRRSCGTRAARCSASGSTAS